jgi:hypothetical protein
MARGLRRLRAVTAVTDALGVRALKAVTEKTLPAGTRVLLDQHRRYVKAEQVAFEDVTGTPQTPGFVSLSLLLPSDIDPKRMGRLTDRLTMREMLDTYARAGGSSAVTAPSPQIAAALLIERVLQNTNLLDIIRAEDAEEMHREREAEKQRKR